jgi:hypothetical protein
MSTVDTRTHDYVADWRKDVAANETRLGYEAWLTEYQWRRDREARERTEEIADRIRLTIDEIEEAISNIGCCDISRDLARKQLELVIKKLKEL